MVLEIKHANLSVYRQGRCFWSAVFVWGVHQGAFRLEKGPSGPVLIFVLFIGGNGLHVTDDTHMIKLIQVFALTRHLWWMLCFQPCCSGGVQGTEFVMLNPIKGTASAIWICACFKWHLHGSKALFQTTLFRNRQRNAAGSVLWQTLSLPVSSAARRKSYTAMQQN